MVLTGDLYYLGTNEAATPVWGMGGDWLRVVGACDRNGHRYEVQGAGQRDVNGLSVTEFVILCLGCGDCRTVRPD